MLIGTPRAADGDQSVDQVLTQLRQRQIANEQVLTFENQQRAAEKERELKEAQATAAMQADLTNSKVRIQVEQNEGAAALARAKQKAEQTVAEAEAEKQKRVLEGKVEAYGGPQYRLVEILGKEFFQAIRDGKVAIVPQIQLGQAGGSGDLVQAMLALALQSQGLGGHKLVAEPPPKGAS